MNKIKNIQQDKNKYKILKNKNKVKNRRIKIYKSIIR